MRAILTIFPHPDEREVKTRPTPAIEPPGPKRTEGIVPVANANATGTIESLILQRLLAELDARAVARAQTPYLVEPSQQARRTGWFRALFTFLWMASIVVCIFVVKYIDSEKTAQKPDPGQVRSITNLTATINDQNKLFSQMADSIGRLASAVASSSLRTSTVQGILSRLGPDLKPPSRAILEKVDPGPVNEKVDFSALNQKFDFVPKPPAVVMIAPPKEQDPSEIPMGGHHHQTITDVVATDNVVVHHNKFGVMDYWLVPRIVSGMRIMTKVVPIAQTTMGVFVHNVEEVKDYIVTPSGDWIPSSESSR